MKTVEFRGCDNLVIAEVTAGDATTYTTGTVEELAPVAEIGKTVENSSETHYYDNVGQVTIKAEGSDTVTLTVPALPLAVLSKVTGRSVDTATGALIEDDAEVKYFAIGYRIKLTDGTFRYVWRFKGTFNIPDETSSTESDGVDTNNQSLEFTGVKTIHKFTYSDGSKKHAKAVVVDERDGKCDVDDWFDAVVTPETLSTLVKKN